MDKNRHLISKYLEGELDSFNQARFEEILKSDTVLRSEVDLYVKVDDAISDTELLDFRSQLNSLHEELTPELRKIPWKSTRRVVQATAAALLLVVLTFGSLNFFWNRPLNERFLNEFYSPYEMTMVNRSASSDINILIHQALSLYENQEYRKAVSLFEEVLEKDPSQMATRLYSGISFFEIKEYQKASNSFTTIIDHKDNLYIEQAEWYRGFCFIMMNEKQKATRQFEKIMKSDGYYGEKAREILKKLK